MKRTSTLMIVLLMTVAGLIGADVGDRVGDLSLTDAEGKVHSLSGYSGKVVVLAFWSFKCPVALAYDERMRDLNGKYSGRDVVFLAVSSNVNETAVEIRRNAANLKLPYPVLMDAEGELAARLGATFSPSVFILDRGGVVRYQGAVDNNKRPGERGRVPHVENALDSILSGQTIEVQETPPFGCALRRTGR